MADLAGSPVSKTKGRPLPIFEQIDELDAQFRQAHTDFTQIAQKELVIPYAGEWFLDNFYIVQQAVRQIVEDMPPDYYNQLPKLVSGPLAGYPRVYALAHEYGRHVHARIAQEEQFEFIQTFQQHATLTTGELWAWPVMLRVMVLENLVIALDHVRDISTPELIPDAIRNDQEADPDADALVSNCIIGLRAINVQNWRAFFEAVSRVEAILRSDPAGIYENMDFATRDCYRRKIEELANHSPKSEEEVAQSVLRLAQRGLLSDRAAHVGYYLVASGLDEVEAVIGYEKPFRERLGHWAKRHALLLYIGTILVLSIAIIALGVHYAAFVGGNTAQILAVLLLLVIPAATVATHFVNWIANKLAMPSVLPKLDFKAGIPAEYPTMVVIPALLTDADEIDSLAGQLEQHYLRNTDPNLYFAILADFLDADEEHTPDDEALLEHAKLRLQQLNAQYQTADHQPFYLFLRRRQWNPSEGKWMGHERKRGKLMEFNHILLDPHAETSYILKLGKLSVLSKIVYIISLDADTVLPRDAAHRLVGTFAHPLNKAQFGADGRIEAGFTILQPRVEVMPTAANQTPFTRIFAGERGLDLYTLAVSDVYQDLFGEGIYVGKGIYDVAAFEKSLKNRSPENALLSHDLFEGLHGRAALVTDIVLLEDYPANYLTSMNRLHRWVRGDWQLLPFLLPRVPDAKGGYVTNIFSVLDLWKIVDNLRRSLLQPALLFLILASWLWLPGSAFVWTALATLVLMTPFLIDITNQLDRAIFFTFSNRSQRERLLVTLLRWGLSFVFLPYEAVVRLNAIFTTLIRLRQRKHLLQWTTAANAARIFRQGSLRTVWQRMSAALMFVAAVAVIALLVHPQSAIVSIPLVILWLSSPILADRISQQPEEKPREILDDRELRTLARRTWLYFEEFVGPGDHWLPPDHYRQSPGDKVGHYTSPTNIGLMLLSTLAAYDLGYIGLLESLLRLRFAFESIGRLEHYRGHLLNWHHTQTLQPLPPRYVSTVDSGNFAGALLVLKQGFDDLLDASLLRPQRWQGIIDTLDVLDEILDDVKSPAPDVRRQLKEMRDQVLIAQQKPESRSAELSKIMSVHWQPLSEAILAFVEGEADIPHLKDLRIYVARLHAHLSGMRRDMELLLPWHILLEQVPVYLTNPSAEIDGAWRALNHEFSVPPQLGDMQTMYERIQTRVRALDRILGSDSAAAEARVWCQQLDEALNSAKSAAHDLLVDFHYIQDQVEAEFQGIDFSFLYSEERHFFHIGYNVDAERLDNSYYDLLASEARLASFLAIAKRDVPQNHWLQLSRPVTLVDNVQSLLSWSGTMFEYLMPLLLMRDYSGTLLHQSYEAVVNHQIQYGKQHNIPWGISESGYYAFDGSQNYQYHAFGIPSLALKRGQDRDLVIAPYASVLALPIRPQAVLDNIRALKAHSALSTHGLIEAIDYTPSRLPVGQDHAAVREYMAHHQCMIFLTLANFLNDNIMVNRFHSDPRVKSVELLLMEQVPHEVTVEEKPAQEIEQSIPVPFLSLNPWEVSINSPLPEAHFLSNGQYAVMVTNAGGGYSQWKSQSITRWRADSTLDDSGTWIYLRDLDSGALWSPAFQPMGSAESMRVVFHTHKAEFLNRNQDVSSRMEILVPPDDDLEIRRLWLTNHTSDARQLLVTSYTEVVLSPQSSDQRHPAFNKMFIESEYLPELQALVFRRRPRSENEEPLYVLHMLVSGKSDVQCETDRARFLGRNRTVRNPIIFDEAPQFSGITGSTLDPIMALAQELEIPGHSTVEVAYITMAGNSREEMLALARQYRHLSKIEQAFDQSRYRGERELRRLKLDTHDIAHFQKLLSAMHYPHALFRAEPHILASNTKSQSGLWAYGISGDHPIILVQVNDEEELGLVSDLLQAHHFWRSRGFASTLVILNQRDTGYMQELYNQIHRLIVRAGSETWINRHDGIFILRAEQMNDADRILLQTSARVYLRGDAGNLEKQVAARQWNAVALPPFMPTLGAAEIVDSAVPLQRPENLLFDNGFGGFTPDGREYVVYTDSKSTTPAPWINVIANESAGFTLSEAGGGFSWSQNSSENRLSVWRNDAVTDMPAEAIYLRDEEIAAVWSPTPMPAGTDLPYRVRHGAGYSMIEHQSHGLHQTVSYYMSPDSPVKFVRVKLKNTASRARRITVTYYIEWVLGPLRDMTQQYLVPEFDVDNQTLLVHNPYSLEFGQSYAFITANQPFHGVTTDRTEFLGRMGSYQQPAALGRIGFSNAVSAGFDPCAVVQLHIDLPIGGTDEICFILGAGAEKEAARQFSRKYRTQDAIEKAWNDTIAGWRNILDSVVVRTPDPAMNLLLPWLLYQALSCRIWGRSALYQSGGAYGFRDQLQDVMALIHVRPELAREQILDAARHQFEAGDVLHWWHPPSGRGVRTRFADDLVWLPYVVAHYLTTTGDESILIAKEPFLKGEPLRPEEEERYGFYESTAETYTIYEHCCRALKQADTSGRHGLPLMKAGDWNDGMSRVGIKGRGESVWMGWFLYTALDQFRQICILMNDSTRAETYQRRMRELQDALENSAWDGDWYLRAYYDNGAPMGSKQSEECQIDSLTQSWAVFSGAARPERAQRGMESVLEKLVRQDDQLIQLFTPPFDHTQLDPGYIKGYPPGIRENGGQYTHAALWVVWALTKMGRGTQAEALFRLLNPIYHSDSAGKANLYRVEPYVVAADVYSVPPHTGRGGWTWYTGSSGWMYRLGVEAILGLHREGAKLRIDPRISQAWPGYEVDYRYGKTTYAIEVKNPDGVEQGVREIRLDGEVLASNVVSLVDDVKAHTLIVVMGKSE